MLYNTGFLGAFNRINTHLFGLISGCGLLAH